MGPQLVDASMLERARPKVQRLKELNGTKTGNTVSLVVGCTILGILWYRYQCKRRGVDF